MTIIRKEGVGWNLPAWIILKGRTGAEGEKEGWVQSLIHGCGDKVRVELLIGYEEKGKRFI